MTKEALTINIVGTRDSSPNKTISKYQRTENGQEYMQIKNIKDATIEIDSLLQQIYAARRER